MGSPFQARVVAVDREARLARLRRPVGRGADASRSSAAASYYLEDKPQYLDCPGEFWFDRKGALAAGCTSACPATRTPTRSASRWPSAST